MLISTNSLYYFFHALRYRKKEKMQVEAMTTTTATNRHHVSIQMLAAQILPKEHGGSRCSISRFQWTSRGCSLGYTCLP